MKSLQVHAAEFISKGDLFQSRILLRPPLMAVTVSMNAALSDAPAAHQKRPGLRRFVARNNPDPNTNDSPNTIAGE